MKKLILMLCILLISSCTSDEQRLSDLNTARNLIANAYPSRESLNFQTKFCEETFSRSVGHERLNIYDCSTEKKGMFANRFFVQEKLKECIKEYKGKDIDQQMVDKCENEYKTSHKVGYLTKNIEDYDESCVGEVEEVYYSISEEKMKQNLNIKCNSRPVGYKRIDALKISKK